MAEAARSPTEIHAGARDPLPRRRGGWRPPPPPPPPPRPSSDGSATDEPATKDVLVGADVDSGRNMAALEETVAGGTAGAGASDAGDAGAVAPASTAAFASAAVEPGSGSNTTRPACALGRIEPSPSSSRLTVGRLSGSLARQLVISCCNSSGRSPSSAGLLTSRYISRALDPEPNGPWPLAAYTSTAPRLKMSLAGPTSWPRACSGDKNPDEPESLYGSVLSSAPGAIPKPTSRGPFRASRTVEGLRFRCTTPTACSAARPLASPAASASSSSAGSGPSSRTLWASDGPSTYAVASHGTGPSRSASSTGAMKVPLTCRAAATSARNSGSAANSAGKTVTTTPSPVGDRPRNTPRWPHGPSSS